MPLILLLFVLLSGSALAAPSANHEDKTGGIAKHKTPSANAGARLAAKLERYQSMRFGFRQQISSAVEGYFEETKGYAYLQRPNKVRWETTHPFSQLIVSNGDVVWLYDPDLLQAIRQTPNLNPALAPALLLLGDAETMERYFEVYLLGTRDKIEWFLLSPKAQNLPVKLIEIGFKGNKLHSFLIEDHHLQRSLFILENWRANPKIAHHLFQFTPPPGTDIADQVASSKDCGEHQC